jgi:hypothetical protein
MLCTIDGVGEDLDPVRITGEMTANQETAIGFERIEITCAEPPMRTH